jgi:Prokaryotic RING finger family 1/GYF domain 2
MFVETCPYCREPIEGADAVRCPSCATPHHRDCFVENGGCTVFGCESGPSDEQKITVSVNDASFTAPRRPLPSESLQNQTLYIVHRGEQQFGPYSLRELQQFIIEKRLAMTDLAWSEGMPEWVFLEDVVGTLQQPVVRKSDVSQLHAAVNPLFFYIPIARLVAMSLLTLGLYEIYWMYRNWKFVKQHDNRQIQPFWRAIFGIFFIKSLLSEIKDDKTATSLLRAQFSPGGLAAGWIILTLIGTASSRSPDPAARLFGIAISSPAFLFLIPVQRYVNALNERLPQRPEYCGWSAGQIILLLVGGLLVLFNLLTLIQ